MFSQLVESVPRGRGIRNVSGTSLSFAVHALLVFGAICATKRSDFAVVGPREYLDLPYLTDPARHADPSPPPPIPVIGQLVIPDAPVIVPVGIPPVDPGLVVDTLTVLRSRVDPAPVLGPSIPVRDDNSVIAEGAVDERPEVISGFTPEYPDLLRQAGIEGTVIVEAVVDTGGHAEPGSIRVVRSTNRAFDNSAREAVLRTVYRAGRVGSERVRVLVQVPITFAIRE
jgi:protein TonB